MIRPSHPFGTSVPDHRSNNLPLHHEMSEPVSVALTFPWMDGCALATRLPRRSSNCRSLTVLPYLTLPCLAFPPAEFPPPDDVKIAAGNMRNLADVQRKMSD
jgi:hypothetical protein